MIALNISSKIFVHDAKAHQLQIVFSSEHSKMVFILLFFLTLLQCIGIEGFETEPRIFGGQLVPKKEDFKFRWLVAFHNRLADHFFCAGSLISAAHVLSSRARS